MPPKYIRYQGKLYEKCHAAIAAPKVDPKKVQEDFIDHMKKNLDFYLEKYDGMCNELTYDEYEGDLDAVPKKVWFSAVADMFIGWVEEYLDDNKIELPKKSIEDIAHAANQYDFETLIGHYGHGAPPRSTFKAY